jgi:hypothetical protein
MFIGKTMKISQTEKLLLQNVVWEIFIVFPINIFFQFRNTTQIRVTDHFTAVSPLQMLLSILEKI